MLYALRDFSHQQNEKNLMRYRARKFLEKKALRHHLKYLVNYTIYRREKNFHKAEMKCKFEEKWAAQVFIGLR